jgi:hypothetical protein
MFTNCSFCKRKDAQIYEKIALKDVMLSEIEAFLRWSKHARLTAPMEDS